MLRVEISNRNVLAWNELREINDAEINNPWSANVIDKFGYIPEHTTVTRPVTRGRAYFQRRADRAGGSEVEACRDLMNMGFMAVSLATSCDT